MFVRNRTGLPVRLAHGHLSDDFAVGSVNLESAFALGEGRLAPVPLPPRTDADPPDIGGYPLWDGVSVTANGSVVCPSAPPFVQPVVVTVGAEVERLAVFGPRRWTRSFGGGVLRPSPPERFDHLPMTWDHAFGGAFVLPPGLLFGTDLPHPGGRVAYTLNEQGVGFYADEASASEHTLPRIERAEGLVQHWNDRPEPSGLAPCPQLAALRLSHQARRMGERPTVNPTEVAPVDATVVLSLLHHAPPRLIVREPPPLTSVSLDGFASGPIRFEIPDSPIEVVVRIGKVGEPVRPRLRSVHVDAARRLVRVTHGHMFRYSPDQAPAWILVTRREQ